MSDLSIDLHWQRAEAYLKTGAYSAEHTIQYNNRFDILADAAPDWGGDAENTNPEQATGCRSIQLSHDDIFGHCGQGGLACGQLS
jgi:hypothetical protein